jgi:peptidoglycan hydrolase CwlO-like protein
MLTEGMPMMSSGRPMRKSPAGRQRKILSAAVALVLAASLGASAPAAYADDLEDQQAALKAEAARVQESLEFVDAKISKAAGDLVIYRGQLPAAQQALLEAQGRVASAVKEVEALAARVDLAQQNKAKITQQLDADKQKIASTKKLIGQIATQAYKSGGVPSNLSLFFGSNNGSLTDTIDLADQALRSQNSA